MSLIWAFDPMMVVQRSLMAAWIRDQPDVMGCHLAVARGREALAQCREVERTCRPTTRFAGRRACGSFGARDALRCSMIERVVEITAGRSGQDRAAVFVFYNPCQKLFRNARVSATEKCPPDECSRQGPGGVLKFDAGESVRRRAWVG
jgi:hypothetical protein